MDGLIWAVIIIVAIGFVAFYVLLVYGIFRVGKSVLGGAIDLADAGLNKIQTARDWP
jgi:hypothetical protein